MCYLIMRYMKYKIIKKCQICNNRLFNFLDLGKQPLCDDLTEKPNSSNFFKLKVSYCKKCLTTNLRPNASFENGVCLMCNYSKAEFQFNKLLKLKN